MALLRLRSTVLPLTCSGYGASIADISSVNQRDFFAFFVSFCWTLAAAAFGALLPSRSVAEVSTAAIITLKKRLDVKCATITDVQNVFDAKCCRLRTRVLLRGSRFYAESVCTCRSQPCTSHGVHSNGDAISVRPCKHSTCRARLDETQRTKPAAVSFLLARQTTNASRSAD